MSFRSTPLKFIHAEHPPSAKYISKCHIKKTAPILLGGLFFCPLKKYINKDRNGVVHYGGLV